MNYPQANGPIGVFDSGYGGLTILHGIRQLLPEYDYIYVGDTPALLTAHARSTWFTSSPDRP